MSEPDRLFDPGADRATYVRGMFGEIAVWIVSCRAAVSFSEKFRFGL